jgi:cell division protein ZapA
MPIGIPGWPLLAASTASIASARMALARLVDRKAKDAAGALGTLSESRQLLFASLLLADELKEHRSGQAPALPAELDPAMVDALERLAARVESLAEQLERSAPAS